MDALKSTKKRVLPFLALAALLLAAISPIQAQSVGDFLGFWMGVSADGSYFKVSISDVDGDEVAEVTMHDTYWSICGGNLAEAGGSGTVVGGVLEVDLTIQCLDANGDPDGPAIPITVFYERISRHVLELTGPVDPVAVHRVATTGGSAGTPTMRKFIGFWMGVSADGSYFKVSISDNDKDGVAEVNMHDTYWSICGGQRAEAYGTGTVVGSVLEVDFTIQCLDVNGDPDGSPFALTLFYEIKSGNVLELSGPIDPTPVFRVSLGGGGGALESTVDLENDSEDAISLETSPAEFMLERNYPNPFNPSTTITYALKEDARVSIKVYDMLGRLVKVLVDQHQNSGYKSVVWDGTDLTGNSVASGTYFYKMMAGEYSRVNQMMLAR